LNRKLSITYLGFAYVKGSSKGSKRFIAQSRQLTGSQNRIARSVGPRERVPSNVRGSLTDYHTYIPIALSSCDLVIW